MREDEHLLPIYRVRPETTRLFVWQKREKKALFDVYFVFLEGGKVPLF